MSEAAHILTQVLNWNDDGTLCLTDVTRQPCTAAEARARRIRRLKEARQRFTETDGAVSIVGEHFTTTLTWEDQP